MVAGDEGVRALSGGTALKRLRILSLAHCELDLPRLQPLLDPASLPTLRVLSLRDNGLSDREQERLRARFGVGLLA